MLLVHKTFARYENSALTMRMSSLRYYKFEDIQVPTQQPEAHLTITQGNINLAHSYLQTRLRVSAIADKETSPGAKLEHKGCLRSRLAQWRCITCVDRTCTVFLKLKKLHQLQNHLLSHAALVSADSENNTLWVLFKKTKMQIIACPGQQIFRIHTQRYSRFSRQCSNRLAWKTSLVIDCFNECI
jgi:hypothetical protein